MDNQWQNYMSNTYGPKTRNMGNRSRGMDNSNVISLDSRRKKNTMSPNWTHIVGFVFAVGASIYIWRIT